ncbi:MAG: radical SAM protein [Deltaproteobacteria bacterium]|nr:radical SAM protein [Deltaproteobacteria bacterium]
MINTLDLLFIHVPGFSSFSRPYGECMTINLLPMGTWSLADLSVRNGYKTKILHLGLAWIKNGVFSPLSFLKEKKPLVVAIPLHWHQQSYDVMKVAGEIKRYSPDIFIVLGGYTASFFSRDIMASFSQIDAIIRGDAEAPLTALMASIKNGKELKAVPNLIWRERDEIRENPISFVANESDLDASSFANLDLLLDSSDYVHYMGMPFVWAKGLSKEKNRRYFHLGPAIFPLNIGRGCSGNCTWCGGGNRAQYLVNGRRSVVFRTHSKVADTVSEAVESGYEMIHIAFDPGKEGERYYLELFPLLRMRGLRVKCYFESFSIPSETFLKAFAATFDLNGSIIALSPESGDERIRRRNKSFSFSNDALMKTISRAEKLGIRVDIFFAMGIPGEKFKDLAKTYSLRKEIKRRFKNIGRTWTSPISIEPAAPWYMNPEEFGIVSLRNSFEDFFRAGAGSGGIGYYIPDYLGNGKLLDRFGFERLLKRTRCRHHCSFHPNPAKSSSPFRGRIYCRYMRWIVGGVRG